MALREIGEDGRSYLVENLAYDREFQLRWNMIPEDQRNAITVAINRRLDSLIESPDAYWGSITNTSIEGGKPNPITGIRGDWTGTVFQPIYDLFGNEESAGMFYGNIWKQVIIDRDELWIGIRQYPTFPERGISLPGKTYFLANH